MKITKTKLHQIIREELEACGTDGTAISDPAAAAYEPERGRQIMHALAAAQVMMQDDNRARQLINELIIMMQSRFNATL
jgi:hypothetical protein